MTTKMPAKPKAKTEGRGKNNWNKALKKANEGKEGWCIPKKGTKFYDEVINIKKELDSVTKYKGVPMKEQPSYRDKKGRDYLTIKDWVKQSDADEKYEKELEKKRKEGKLR